MSYCKDCLHQGTFKPTRGGYFYTRDGVESRLMNVTFPWCGELNMLVAPDDFINCNYFGQFKPTIPEPPEEVKDATNKK